MIDEKKLYPHQLLILKGINFVKNGGVIINNRGRRMGKQQALKIAEKLRND